MHYLPSLRHEPGAVGTAGRHLSAGNAIIALVVPCLHGTAASMNNPMND